MKAKKRFEQWRAANGLTVAEVEDLLHQSLMEEKARANPECVWCHLNANPDLLRSLIEEGVARLNREREERAK